MIDEEKLKNSKTVRLIGKYVGIILGGAIIVFIVVSVVSSIINSHLSNNDNELIKSSNFVGNDTIKKPSDSLSTKQIKEKNKADELLMKKRIAEVLKKLRTQYDDINGITWYFDKSTPVQDNVKNIHLYFGMEKTGKPWLRLKIRYAGSNWLFIHSYIIKTDDGSFTIPVSFTDVNRDNGYYGVKEYYDTEVNEEIMKIVKSIINSKIAKIRYLGQQYKYDKMISSSEKEAMENVLYAYDIYDGD